MPRGIPNKPNSELETAKVENLVDKTIAESASDSGTDNTQIAESTTSESSYVDLDVATEPAAKDLDPNNSMDSILNSSTPLDEDVSIDTDDKGDIDAAPVDERVHEDKHERITSTFMEPTKQYIDKIMKVYTAPNVNSKFYEVTGTFYVTGEALYNGFLPVHCSVPGIGKVRGYVKLFGGR